MNNLNTSPAPFFELIITKFAIKSVTIKMFKELSSSTPGVKYETTLHSKKETHEGIENDEGKAFAAAIALAGYAPKERALPEIQKHHHFKGNLHKIGGFEFSKVIRKSLH